MLAHELSLIIPLVIGAVVGVLVWTVRESNERDRARAAGETPRRISPWGSIVVCAVVGGALIGGFWNASHESQARAAHDVLQGAFDREGAGQVKLAGALGHQVTTPADLDAVAAGMHGAESDLRQAQGTLTGIDRGDYGPDELALVDALRRVNVAALAYIAGYERVIDGHLMSVDAGAVQLAPAERTRLIRAHMAFDRAWLAAVAPGVKLRQITPAQGAKLKQQLGEEIARLQSCLCQQAA